MKSWLKALFISVVILAGCIVYLPTLAKQGINSLLPWAMEQATLEQGNAHLSQLSWHTLIISDVDFHLPSNNSQIKLRDIKITFSPWSLAAGSIKDVSIEYAQVTIKSADKPTETLAIPKNRHSAIKNTPSNSQPVASENTALELASLEDIFQQLPLDTLTIEQFELVHPQLTINGKVEFNKQKLNIHNSIQSSLLDKDLRHELTINHQGQISSLIFIEQQTAPIFNLSANWLMPSDLSQPAILTLQQSADIQSWLSLIKQKNQTQSLEAKVAIQAWNLALNLPTVINNQQEFLTQVSATSFLQLKINDFKIFDLVDNKPTLDHANLDISLNANIDHQREDQWQFSLDTFNLAGDMTSLEPTDLRIEQHLKDALLFTCNFKIEDNNCKWQGALIQQLTGDQLSHKTELELVGQYSQALNDTAKFYSQQILNLDTQQKNSSWPKFTNKSQGEIIVQGQQNENNWYWQVSLPHGFNNQSYYLDALFPDKTEAKLSAIHWQLLPDWLIEGIDGELTQAKDFSVIIEQLNWQYKKEKLALENAQVSCNLDWLKLQYSPQLRSQQALSQLPLACHWDVKNKKTHWNQWPVPSLLFNGKFDLSAIDLKQAKLTASMKLTGLSNSLDLTLLAQHDFNHLQQGSAQLYLNNLKLDWQKMGLIAMADLTEAKLLNGSLSAQGWLQWQQYQADIFDDNSIAWRWQPDLMLRIDDMSGIYQELTTWEDIDIQLAIRRPFYDDFRIDSQISALSINPGINIENILARSTTTIESDFSQALVVIEEVHTDVLGGRINVPLIRYDTRQEVNAFGIEVEGLQLEQLAALESGSGVTATGRLDGVLPIILLPEGPQIPAGSLYARAPGGVVQFRGATADSLKQSDPSVSLAMQVLNDFRYDKLQTDVTYQPDGELNLGLQFQGYNPTFFDGQATHFNLNLEYNLLDLLESLRVSNDIVQKLENKYQ